MHILGDILDTQDVIEGESIDYFLLDPPYFLGEVEFENKKKQYSRVNEDWDNEWDDFKHYIHWVVDWCKVVQSKGKPGAAITIFCSHHNSHYVKYAIEVATKTKQINFTFRNQIPWYVTNAMPILFAKQIGLYAYTCQYILYYTLGPTKTFNYDYLKSINDGKQHRDIIIGPSRKHDKTLKHPTRKPLWLIEQLIKTHSNEGDVVCDFFSGSGTTGIACIENNRDFILVEKIKEYYDEAEKRLEEKLYVQSM